MDHMAAVKEKYPMVSLITYIIGVFDPYGVNHSERVAELSMRIGERIGLDETQMEELILAGHLHDIGKLGIPESIRTKPGKLTEAEFFLMQQHTSIGLKIIRKMNGAISQNVHLAIYHHHEDYGGTGYPDGISGKQIPLLARILRIADTYDALTNSRGYKLPLDGNGALATMVHDQEREQLFDPELFRVFMAVMLDK